MKLSSWAFHSQGNGCKEDTSCRGLKFGHKPGPAKLRSVEITLALYHIMAWKIIVSFKYMVLEYIPITTNRYVDALANIIVIRRKALAINAAFPEEVSNDDDWRETIKIKLSKLSEELNIKYLKKHINVVGTLYKRLPGWVLTRCFRPKEAQRWFAWNPWSHMRSQPSSMFLLSTIKEMILLVRDETTTTCIQVKRPKCSKTLSLERQLQFPSRMAGGLYT